MWVCTIDCLQCNTNQQQRPRLKLQIYYSRNSTSLTWGMTWLRFPDNAAWGQGTVPLPCQPLQGYTVHTPAVGCYVGGGSRWRRGNERAAVTPVCMCVGVCVRGWVRVCMHVRIHVREKVYCTKIFNQQLGDTLIIGWVIKPIWYVNLTKIQLNLTNTMATIH